MAIYEPAEDSYLLQRYVKEYALGRVLDMGTGSGIQALEAMRNPNVREVVAVDINEEAVEQLREKVRKERIRKVMIVQSDLFQQIEGCFNLIIFNPPYLPQDTIGERKEKKVVEDRALYGGKKGWEVSERFFREVSKYMFKDSVILFLFSSLTNKQKIEEILAHNMLEGREVERKKIDFEELYVYEVKKSLLLREMEKEAIDEVHYFAKGSRGVIYTGRRNASINVKKMIPLKIHYQRVAIKIKNIESKAEGSIRNEGLWLERLNDERIGPKLIKTGEVEGKEYVIYQFVEGKEILNWIDEEKRTKQEIQKVLQDVLEQCFRLDQLGVTKEEMHHPVKHILVTERNVPFLIDFERTRQTDKPQNVTQFVEFICRIREQLEKRGVQVVVEKLRDLAKEYKKEPILEKYHQINDKLFL
jgi:release factor glutamine methyltransferase